MNYNHPPEAQRSPIIYPEAKKIFYTNVRSVGSLATYSAMVENFEKIEQPCLLEPTTVLGKRCGYLFAYEALVTLKSITINKQAEITFSFVEGRLVATFKGKGCPEEVRIIGQTSTRTYFTIKFSQGGCRLILDWNEPGADGTHIGNMVQKNDQKKLVQTVRFVATLNNGNRGPLRVHQTPHVRLTSAEQLATSPCQYDRSNEAIVVNQPAPAPNIYAPSQPFSKHFTNVFILVPDDNKSLRNIIWNGLKVYESLVSDDTILARFSVDSCRLVTIMAITYSVKDFLKVSRLMLCSEYIIFCGHSESPEQYVLSALIDGPERFELQDPFLEDAWPTRDMRKSAINRKSARILDMIQKHNKLNRCYGLMIPQNVDNLAMRDTLFDLVIKCPPTPITPELYNCWKSNTLEGSPERNVDDFLQYYSISAEMKAGLDTRQVLVRSVTFDKSSQMMGLLELYSIALQPTTGNQVPYKRMSDFFIDEKDLVRQGAMFAMLANSALVKEGVQAAMRYKNEAVKCLAREPTDCKDNMALYVSVLIDVGTYYQACFDFDAALPLYRKIKSFADQYPHLFTAASNQSNRFVEIADLQESKHYPGCFDEIRNATNNNALHHNTNQVPRNNVTNDEITVISYALPKTPEESLSFHLGYTYVILTLLTNGDELKGIQKEIRDSNLAKLGSHRLFYEVSDMLYHLNKIATLYLLTQVRMDLTWFQADLEYAHSKMLQVDLGRRIFLYGQFKLACIHGMMAANMGDRALVMVHDLVDFADDQFLYGKTNILGFIYLFSACVCYKYLQQYHLFTMTRRMVDAYALPGLPLAERCVEEIIKFDADRFDEIAPYFAKLAAILQNSEVVAFPENQSIVYSSQWTVLEKFIVQEKLLNFRGPIYASFYSNNYNSPAQVPATIFSSYVAQQTYPFSDTGLELALALENKMEDDPPSNHEQNCENSQVFCVV